MKNESVAIKIESLTISKLVTVCNQPHRISYAHLLWISIYFKARILLQWVQDSFIAHSITCMQNQCSEIGCMRHALPHSQLSHTHTRSTLPAVNICDDDDNYESTRTLNTFTHSKYLDGIRKLIWFKHLQSHQRKQRKKNGSSL